MIRPTNNHDLQRELSIDELEAIAGGSQLMSGAPNSINGAWRVQPASPPPPRIWMGGSPATGAHLSAF